MYDSYVVELIILSHSFILQEEVTSSSDGTRQTSYKVRQVPPLSDKGKRKNFWTYHTYNSLIRGWAKTGWKA